MKFSLVPILLLAISHCSSTSTGAPPGQGPDASLVDATVAHPDSGSFQLTSGAFTDNGTMSAEYTCDSEAGPGHNPPLAWSGAPAATNQYALLMTTVAKDGLKWNWVVYGISAATTHLDANAMAVGTAGITSDGPLLAYSPPCSAGPGLKTYTFTLYALSGAPSLPSPANQVTGAVLTSAIASLTIATTAITAGYTR